MKVKNPKVNKITDKSDNKLIAYFINKNKKKGKEYYTNKQLLNNDTLSYLIAYKYKEDDITISNLFTKDSHRGNKYSFYLLKKLCDEHKNCMITLDDMTDIEPPKNLYYRLGFKVKSNKDRFVKWYHFNGAYTNGPERIIRSDDLNEKLDEFI